MSGGVLGLGASEGVLQLPARLVGSRVEEVLASTCALCGGSWGALGLILGQMSYRWGSHPALFCDLLHPVHLLSRGQQQRG